MIAFLNMDFVPASLIPKIPKKRSPVKKQASICVDTESKGEFSEQLENLQRLNKQLTERVQSLEHAQSQYQEALDHLLTEDSTDPTLSEDEQN